MPTNRNGRNALGTRSHRRLQLFCFVVLLSLSAALSTHAAPDYAEVDAIFQKHCIDCHAAKDAEATFVLDSHEGLLKGGETGAAIVKGNSRESLLIKRVRGEVEKDGKTKIMPPGKREKLRPAEIELLSSWIDSGAKPPENPIKRELSVKSVAPKNSLKSPIHAIASDPDGKTLALGRYSEIDLVEVEGRGLIRTLGGHTGAVNALVYSSDGRVLFSGGGQPGLEGEIRAWKTEDGSLLRSFTGHTDSVHALALSVDGKTLASGSYDQTIKLWNTQTGAHIRTLKGHNGALYDLAFRPDGKILASASGDRTVKLWDVSTGERRDTLSQPLKEVLSLAFSPDGKHLVAGGGDNRIRLWQISATAAETTNPLVESKFAHEGALLRLRFSTSGKVLISSADDRTLKIWDLEGLNEKLVFERQPDWTHAVTFVGDGRSVAAGRLDGSLEIYETDSGKPKPLPKPELVVGTPRGVLRGVTSRVKLSGNHLAGVTNVLAHNRAIKSVILWEPKPSKTEAWVSITPEASLAPGTYEFSAISPAGESARLKLYVDSIAQLSEQGDPGSHGAPKSIPTPTSFWGTIDPAGNTDEIRFEAVAGQTLVIDAAARRLGSKAVLILSLFDPSGALVLTSQGTEAEDPWVHYTPNSSGLYSVRITEKAASGSLQHFYRLTLGHLPFVTSVFPLSIRTNQETRLTLSGVNLGDMDTVVVKASGPGDIDVPLDPAKYRFRQPFKVLVGELPEMVEIEPNDSPAQATAITAPGVVGGRFLAQTGKTDVDFFRFASKKGQAWVIETAAASRGSLADTKLELLDESGKQIPRLALQAVRDSAITFRGIDSFSSDCRVENWEEMHLNQFLYLQGEVVKLFRAPQGPDSGFQFYTSSAKRRTYFDTSATVHANEEPCYIVEPRPIGTSPAPNGLPFFVINHSNDDDGDRVLGSDSRLHFTAPENGYYMIRISETRAFAGDRFPYRLTVRESKPDFKVTLNGADITVNRDSGRDFSLSADRLDGFEGEINIVLDNLPEGWAASTPLAIQAGHTEARGTLFALPSAADPTPEMLAKIRVTARARIGDSEVNKPVKAFSKIKLAEKPRLLVTLESDSRHKFLAQTNGATPPNPRDVNPVEITITPGSTVPAWLSVQRNGYDELVTFSVDNLPHGVIVDNIGLNGVLLPKGELERQIFFTAERWVPETDRLCYAVENQAGRQTSRPVLIKVRKAASITQSAQTN